MSDSVGEHDAETTSDPATDADPILDVRNLRKYYPASTGLFDRMFGEQRYIKAVDDVSLSLQPGEVIGIIGESGSGKSTLVETLLRLEDPTDGTIRFQGEDLTAASSGELRAHREDAQIIFQDPYDTLNPQKTVFQAVAEPLRNFRQLTYDERRETVAETLHRVGLRPAENYMDTYPGQLSGGQRQRVNIARSIVLEPSLLIADEPVSMLDVSLQAGIIKMLDRLKETIGFSMLYVSHNLPVVRLVADRIGVMYRGRLVEVGPAESLMEDPKHPYTRALVSSLPSLSGDRERVELPEPEGDDDELPSGCRFRDRCPAEMPECAEASPALAPDGDRDVACFLHHDEVEE
jgi:peptide/nickel transport system ATP-binding protein